MEPDAGDGDQAQHALAGSLRRNGGQKPGAGRPGEWSSRENYVYYATMGNLCPLAVRFGCAARLRPANLRARQATRLERVTSGGARAHPCAQAAVQSGLGFQWFYVMSNATWVGGGSQIVPDPVTFLPGFR